MTSKGEDWGPSAEAKSRGRRLQVITGAMTALVGASYLLYHQLNAKEEEEEAGPESSKVHMTRLSCVMFLYCTSTEDCE